MKLTSNRTLLLVALAACAALSLTACQGDGPQPVVSPMAQAPESSAPLAWSDEFNGTSLDSTKWNIETGYGENGWGNDEWQLYTDDPANLRVEGGELIITARSNGSYGKRDGSITSGRITTENKLNIRFGTISARIKVPESEATWPAFWGLGASFRSVGWPRCGEIDIMEILNRFSDIDTTHATVHWWNEDKYPPNAVPPLLWDFTGGSRSFGQPLSDDYHVYEAERTAHNIIFRIDGVTVFVLPIDMTMTELADYFFLLLNVAIGGTHGADPNASNFSTPQEMRVDWVRVYAQDGEWNDPPDPSLTYRGIYSETHTNPTLPPTAVINTVDWSADWAESDPESTAVPPKEGVYSMSVDYQDFGAWGGGPVFEFNNADFTQFAGLTTYNTLVFSIDTSALTGFDDIGVEIQDPQGQAGTAALRLKSYTPVEVEGDWKTYAVPLADFTTANPATDLENVVYLMFLTPVDANDPAQKTPGIFYLDDIHLAAYSTTERGIFSERYTAPALRANRIYSTEEWSSSPTDVNAQSTEVPPFEGTYVLTVDVKEGGTDAWGGVIFEYADVDFTALSTLTTYNALVFSLNTSGFTGFDDLSVEIQDSALTASRVNLSDYEASSVSGAWSTYEIPLADFGASDLTQVKNLLFMNPVDDNGDPVAGKFHLDDISLAQRVFGAPPPVGIYSETRTDPTLPPDDIFSNTSAMWGGSTTTIDAASSAVPAFEGSVSLRVDFDGANGPGWGGAVFGFSNADFTVDGEYNALVLSLNTTQFPNFGDLTIELQDGTARPPGVQISNYLPQLSGDWATYTIPLADFPTPNPAGVTALLLFNAVDTNGDPASGVYYVDDMHLVYAPTPMGIYSENYTNPSLLNTPTTNAILMWGGSGSNLVVDSTAVTPVQGMYVLSYEHLASGDGWGGMIFDFAQASDFTDGGYYTTLVFSLNVSAFPTLDKLSIQLQDAENHTGSLPLSAYEPVVNGDWHTYQIPFADFSQSQALFDIDKVSKLLFWDPKDAADAFAQGVFYLDQIYLR